jgi:hypothetical protein
VSGNAGVETEGVFGRTVLNTIPVGSVVGIGVLSQPVSNKGAENSNTSHKKILIG